MATTGNPILFALQGLGTAARDVLTADAQRRRDDLAAQREENTQRRALESLRLSGEQQFAELGLKEAQTRYDITKGERQLGLEGERVATERQRTTDLATFQTGQLDIQERQRKDTALFHKGQVDILQAEETRKQKTFESEEEMVPLGQLIGGMGNTLIQRVGPDEAMPILSHGNAALLAMGYNPQQLVKRREGREIVEQIIKDPTLFLALTRLGKRQEIEQYPVGDPRRDALQNQYDEAFVKPKDLDTAFQHYSTARASGALPEQVTWRDHLYAMGLAKPPAGYQTFDQVKAAVLKTRPDAKRKQMDDPALPVDKRLELHKELDALTIQVRLQYGEINTIERMNAATTPQPQTTTGTPRPTTGAKPAWKASILSADARFARLPEPLLNEIWVASVAEAQKNSVEHYDLLALMDVESKYNPKARNPNSGAAGLMQLIPSTAARYKVQDPYNVPENIRGGAEDWARALTAAKGDPRKAYNTYYNPGASNATTQEFLEAREAFAAREGPAALERVRQQARQSRGVLDTILGPQVAGGVRDVTRSVTTGMKDWRARQSKYAEEFATLNKKLQTPLLPSHFQEYSKNREKGLGADEAFIQAMPR